MAGILEIRRRVRAVKNIQQVTRAMQMVAAARLRRVQEALEGARPYADQMQEVIRGLLEQAEGEAHPLMERREGPRHLDLVIVSTDRGLCGGLNTNLFRRAQTFLKENESSYRAISLDLVGRKAREYFKRRQVTVRKARVGLFPGTPRFEVARALADELMNAFLSGEVDEVGILYSQFRSMLTQRPTYLPLLPLAGDETREEEAAQGGPTGNYLYEPGRQALLASLLPRYVAVQVYRVMLEAQTSEFAARMTAMDNATKNAEELIAKLTLSMNKARQTAITKEILEVVSGAAALE